MSYQFFYHDRFRSSLKFEIFTKKCARKIPRLQRGIKFALVQGKPFRNFQNHRTFPYNIPRTNERTILTLTIYTDDFETENLPNGGFDGHVLAEGKKVFSKGDLSRNLTDALKWLRDEDSGKVDEIVFCFRDGEEQWFRKFVVDKPIS